ncbi:unnamed protein product [Rotaria magnacalcarata]
MSHTIRNDECNAVSFLQLHATKIHRLVLIRSPTVCFTSLNNLRPLTLKYGTPEQFNSIRPEYFPFLEILHVDSGLSLNASDVEKAMDKLLKMLFSNGFPKLRIFTSIHIGAISSRETWSHAPNLRCVHLYLKQNKDYELLLSICPNLRRFTTYEHHVFSPLSGRSHTWDTFKSCILGKSQGNHRRIMTEIGRLSTLEWGGKFMLHECSLDYMTKKSVPARFDNTDVPPLVLSEENFVIRGRIFPSKHPYSLASFLVEIRLPNAFPFAIPRVSFLDPIYHPHVKKTTEICECSLKLTPDNWRPTNSLNDVIETLIEVIEIEPTIGHYHERTAGLEYHSARDTFDQKALSLVLSKGRPREYH